MSHQSSPGGSDSSSVTQRWEKMIEQIERILCVSRQSGQSEREIITIYRFPSDSRERERERESERGRNKMK